MRPEQEEEEEIVVDLATWRLVATLAACLPLWDALRRAGAVDADPTTGHPFTMDADEDHEDVLLLPTLQRDDVALLRRMARHWGGTLCCRRRPARLTHVRLGLPIGLWRSFVQ